MFDQKNKLECFIGKNTHFKGDISSKGTLKIDGRVTGNIESDYLILGEKSFVKGHVNVGGMEIGGTIEGNVLVKDTLEVKSRGQITGDIQTSKLIVDGGGLIDGKILMQKGGAKVLELTPEKLKELNA